MTSAAERTPHCGAASPRRETATTWSPRSASAGTSARPTKPVAPRTAALTGSPRRSPGFCLPDACGHALRGRDWIVGQDERAEPPRVAVGGGAAEREGVRARERAELSNDGVNALFADCGEHDERRFEGIRGMLDGVEWRVAAEVRDAPAARAKGEPKSE